MPKMSTNGFFDPNQPPSPNILAFGTNPENLGLERDPQALGLD